MPKHRISHFETKGIQITIYNSASVQNHSSTVTNDKNIIVAPSRYRKISENYKREAIYASKPEKKSSEIISSVISREAAEFRKIVKIKKKSKRTIAPVLQSCHASESKEVRFEAHLRAHTTN